MKTQKIILILIVTLIYFSFAVFFIYTSPFQKGEINYLKKVTEGSSSPFSLSRLSVYDFSFINLFVPLGLIKIRFLRILIAFLGILIFMAALYKKRGTIPSLLFGFIFALNPITIYYFTIEEKFSLLFLGLSIFFYLIFDKSRTFRHVFRSDPAAERWDVQKVRDKKINNYIKNILGLIILLYCALLETSFVLLLIGFIAFILLKRFNFRVNIEKIRINQFLIYFIIFLVIIFLSFRTLNRDIFIESKFVFYVSNYFAAILLFTLAFFTTQKIKGKNLLLLFFIVLILIEFLIPRFDDRNLFKSSFLAFLALFGLLNINKILLKQKVIFLILIISLLILSPFTHRRVGETILDLEEMKTTSIKTEN